MERRQRAAAGHVLAAIAFALLLRDALGFTVMHEQLERCLQVKGAGSRGRVTLEACDFGSTLQDWQWHPDTLALSSSHTGECLSAFRGQGHDSVRLQSCGASRGHEANQAWLCTAEGDLVLKSRGLYLGTRHSSTKLSLSKEHGPHTAWKRRGGHPVCGERHGRRRDVTAAAPASSANALLRKSFSRVAASEDTRALLHPTVADVTAQPLASVPPAEPSMAFFGLENGMSWKITMLVLSSLALLTGLLILLLNIHYNRKKKAVCDPRAFSRPEAAGRPGSPMPGERAPLTRHPMRQPPSSPSPQRGEILVEWKDGTVTPLFDSGEHPRD